MKTIIIFLSILLLLSISIASAATNVEDLITAKGLTDAERSAVAKALAKASERMPQVRNMEQWQKLGDAFSVTIKNICRTLNVEVNNFLKSDVGILVASVVVYKMIGKDILTIVIYTSAWMGITLMIAFSIFFIHMKKKVKNKDTKEITYQDRFGWDDDLTKTISLCLHIAIWFAFSCVVLGNII